MTILSDIQAKILDPDMPLSSILREATVLAYRLENQELKGWVEQEQDGYTCAAAELPDYRNMKTVSLGDFFGVGRELRNASIAPMSLPDEVRCIATDLSLRQGIRELEDLAESGQDVLEVLWPADAVLMLQTIPVYVGMTCLRACWLLPVPAVKQILDTIRNRLLVFILELEQLDIDIAGAKSGPMPAAQQKRITNLFHNCVFQGSRFSQGEEVSIFDQRHQTVGYQYNAAGDINFEAVDSRQDAIEHLEKLERELKLIVNSQLLDDETVTDSQYHLKKAIIEAQKPEPEKRAIVERIEEAKSLISGLTQAAGLVAALTTAAEKVQQLF